MEEIKKETRKRRKIFLIIFDVVFFGFFFLLSLLLADPWRILIYYDGLHRTSRATGLIFLVVILLSTYIGVFVFRAIFWKRDLSRKKWFCLLAITGILCNPLVAMMIPSRLPGYVSYTRGFHQKMKEQLDIEPVRDWIETLDDTVFREKKRIAASDEFIPSDVRTSIAVLHPAFLIFFQTEEGFNCVKIATGSAGISRLCGVVIGPSKMPTPPSEETFYNEEAYSRHGELRIRLEDGAYVWHD